jgi:hypothetical protein
MMRPVLCHLNADHAFDSRPGLGVDMVCMPTSFLCCSVLRRYRPCKGPITRQRATTSFLQRFIVSEVNS